MGGGGFLLTAFAVNATKGVPPQIVGGQRLDGGEDDVVDAGPQHEVHPVGEAQGVLLRRHDGVDYDAKRSLKVQMGECHYLFGSVAVAAVSF